MSSLAGAVSNHILLKLPEQEIQILQPHLRPVTLERYRVLCDWGTPNDLVFVNRGMICLISSSEKGEMIEAGVVGAEGAYGGEILLHGNHISYRAVVQLSVDGLTIAWSTLDHLLPRLPSLQERILRYLHLLMTQFAQSVVCSRFHPASARLARWLLTSYDRSGGENVRLTQEMLSRMLGVPRTWVNHVAGELQERGLISYRSGVITIRSVEELERYACECYRVTREELQSYLEA